jgi:ABC-type branched-subunit amino acid transport system substrate-binding protein
VRALALVAAAVLATAAITGCSVSGSGGVADDAPLDVYLSVPLSGPRAAEGKAIEAQARRALAAAGGKAGAHPIALKVLDSTGGGRAIDLAAVGANARTASEDAAAIAYIGEVGPASGTSLPINDLAQIPQIVLGPVPSGLDVDNLVALAPGAKDPGAAAVEMLIAAIERAGTKDTTRSQVRDELRP